MLVFGLVDDTPKRHPVIPNVKIVLWSSKHVWGSAFSLFHSHRSSVWLKTPRLFRCYGVGTNSGSQQKSESSSWNGCTLTKVRPFGQVLRICWFLVCFLGNMSSSSLPWYTNKTDRKDATSLSHSCIFLGGGSSWKFVETTKIDEHIFLKWVAQQPTSFCSRKTKIYTMELPWHHKFSKTSSGTDGLW